MYMLLEKEQKKKEKNQPSILNNYFSTATTVLNKFPPSIYSTLQHNIYKYVTFINLRNCTVKHKICTQTKRN